MAQTVTSSPIGPILLRAEAGALTALQIGGGAEGLPMDGKDSLLAEAAAQLAAWFEGKLEQFDLPLAPTGTPRGAEHRNAIAAIPFGDTSSYGALARSIGSSPRAIGQACRRNPFPVIIPCHRVIGTGGAIGYYSGGDGIPTKLWLLEHEQKYLRRKG